jgi:succinate dehydrogenase / fumarate reductase, cytochrome b subunit
MSKALTLYDTAVGKKAAVAVTGVVLYGFVVVHMLGNLLSFAGAEVFNNYASVYKDNPGPLWVARLILFVAVGVHIYLTIQLNSRSRVARHTRYRVQKSQKATWSSKWMMVSGPILLFFIVFHIVNLTWPGWLPGDAEISHRNVYANFVINFSNIFIVVFYVIANFMLGLHLWHGAWSLFQTLGISNTRYNRQGKFIAVAIGFCVAAANICMPIAVYVGIIHAEEWTRECPQMGGVCPESPEVRVSTPASTIHADATEVK